MEENGQKQYKAVKSSQNHSVKKKALRKGRHCQTHSEHKFSAIRRQKHCLNEAAIVAVSAFVSVSVAVAVSVSVSVSVLVLVPKLDGYRFPAPI